MSIDEKDIRILIVITNHKTGSPDTIVEKPGIPISTVHYRIQQLKQEGVLTNDFLSVDLEKSGSRSRSSPKCGPSFS